MTGSHGLGLALTGLPFPPQQPAQCPRHTTVFTVPGCIDECDWLTFHDAECPFLFHAWVMTSILRALKWQPSHWGPTITKDPVQCLLNILSPPRIFSFFKRTFFQWQYIPSYITQLQLHNTTDYIRRKSTNQLHGQKAPKQNQTTVLNSTYQVGGRW